MLYALVDELKARPQPGGRGSCPVCGEAVLAKCGRVKTWHWAHAAGAECDSWSEPVGEWHLSWQSMVRPEFVEVPIGPHRADIVGHDNLVIELQHSSIAPDDIEAREAHYGNIIWLFDATERFQVIRSGERAFFSFGRTRHIENCRAPVFLDFGDHLVQVERQTERMLDRISGYGIARDRRWFVNEYLRGRVETNARVESPRRKERKSDPWESKRPYRWMEFPTRWKAEAHQVKALPKGTPYVPLSYEWKSPDGRRWHVSDDVIDNCPEIANGWAKSELTELRQLLAGRIVILDGVLRLLPSRIDHLRTAILGRASAGLLTRIDQHIDEGRMPILKEETRSVIADAERQRVQATPNPSHRPLDEPRLF